MGKTENRWAVRWWEECKDESCSFSSHHLSQEVGSLQAARNLVSALEESIVLGDIELVPGTRPWIERLNQQWVVVE